MDNKANRWYIQLLVPRKKAKPEMQPWHVEWRLYVSDTAPIICSTADPESHLASPQRLSLSGWQNVVHLPYVWDNTSLCNWYISVWALKLTEGKIAVRMFNSAKEKYFCRGLFTWALWCQLLVWVRYERNFWQEFLMKAESSYRCSGSIYISIS